MRRIVGDEQRLALALLGGAGDRCLAAMYIQWLTACSEIGLPATEATELLGTELPQPATIAAITKKAASAASFREIRIGRRW